MDGLPSQWMQKWKHPLDRFLVAAEKSNEGAGLGGTPRSGHRRLDEYTAGVQNVGGKGSGVFG